MLIIRNIFHKINIHPLFYFFTIIFMITGHIYNYIIFTLIIFIHELGHTLMALFFKWNIDNISIYPYGGISKFSTLINVTNKQEILVLIAGPILQIIFMFIFKDNLKGIYKDNFIFYNYFILIFNLLPIYPLDGGKLVKIIFSNFISFKLTYKINFIISSIFIGFLLGYSIIIKNYIFFIIIIFLYLKLLDININEIYNKFLLERYLYNFDFKKNININNVNQFKKDKNHIINNIDEKKYLNKYFKK